MRTLSTRLKAVLGVLVLTTTAFVAVSITHPGKADAAGCLDGSNQQDVSLPSGSLRYPSSGYFKTTSNCQDINLSGNPWYSQNVRAIKVCFRTAGCQDHWTNVKGSSWYEIATNVKDGTEYYFKFYSYGKWHGLVAD
ncbi:hypothetical protein EV649_7458 [Kribbella sp. VKM Ac-2569]|uniref:hypothetical protein n=1 Tax=Kribbella sp. VKM Ac-2569 TaxID=2512220 RepID=UPI00102CEC6B|nr:hypothetical protein [Kribbella sp. VKM Ac-2569]RZT11804.1 hypothetical protein EV649_7458 [Kribbella sp. VKM Ac-2569]